MNCNNYFNWLSITYRIEINQKLRRIIKEHFETNLNIYTEQDMYDKSLRIIQGYKYRYKK